MTAMANMGNFIVALPPSDIWLTDDQAADFLGYAGTYSVETINEGCWQSSGFYGERFEL